jgi:hypothetical protein
METKGLSNHLAMEFITKKTLNKEASPIQKVAMHTPVAIDAKKSHNTF